MVKMVSSCEKMSPPTIAMPSGRRNSAPTPHESMSGSAPRIAASVVIRIGRKRSSAVW